MATDNTKPVIEFIEGPAPEELVITDLEVGTGDEAPAHSTVTIHYLGVDFESGEEFDSSWSRGQSIDFPLSGLIKGWQDGIPGMKVGGRRELVIPPSLGYGDQSPGGGIAANDTLVFVVDLLKVTS